VNVHDASNTQFTVPKNIIKPPGPVRGSMQANSDLVFNYDSSPFAFWITRRSDPNAMPLFDTRIESLPKTPIPSVMGDNSTALDGFPLVFEDSYIQVSHLFFQSKHRAENVDSSLLPFLKTPISMVSAKPSPAPASGATPARTEKGRSRRTSLRIAPTESTKISRCGPRPLRFYA
jgi:hypothetical protein